jgi:hypothetical protein
LASRVAFRVAFADARRDRADGLQLQPTGPLSYLPPGGGSPRRGG